MKLTLRIAIIFSLLVLATTSMAAKKTMSLKVDAQEVIVVINNNGKKEIRYVPATTIVPKDIVRYTITYKNDNSEAADDVVITNPIPEHMRYIANSATSSSQIEVTYSINKGKSYDSPENLIVVMENGKKRKAIAGEYTDIQWHFKNSLPPGAKGTLEYKARLD